MAITKAKKTEVIAKISAGLEGAETVAFVNFHGLTVKEVTELRKELRGAGVSYYVAKKTLVKRALDAKGITGTQPALPGELAIAWSADPVASPKGVYEFAKTHKDKIALVGGVYQGAYFSKEEIINLASIPSMLALRGQFVGMLNQSIASVVRVFDAKAKQAGEVVVLTEPTPAVVEAPVAPEVSTAPVAEVTEEEVASTDTVVETPKAEEAPATPAEAPVEEAPATA